MTDNKLQFVLSQSTSLLIGIIIASVFHRWYYHRILVSQGAKKEAPLTVFVSVLIGLTACLSALFSASVALGKAHQDSRIEQLANANHDLGISNKNLTAKLHDTVSCLVGVIQYDFGLINDRASLQKAVSTAQKNFARDLYNALAHPVDPNDTQAAKAQLDDFTADTKAVVTAYNAVEAARDARPYKTGAKCV